MAKAKTRPQHSTATKEELERKKIELEIKDLERPFWKRPVYVLAALPTILAVVTLSVGLFNGYFSASLTKLENQKHDLEAQVKDFEAKRDELHSENEQLKTEKESLEVKIADLNRTTQGQIIALEKKRAELEVANKTLSQQNSDISLKKKETENKLNSMRDDFDKVYSFTKGLLPFVIILEEISAESTSEQSIGNSVATLAIITRGVNVLLGKKDMTGTAKRILATLESLKKKHKK